jgi:Glycosyl transferase family 11
VSELRLMAACRHHIIANSTFSWWGAWLGYHEQQVVTAPEPWISTVSRCPDLIPSHWTKLTR